MTDAATDHLPPSKRAQLGLDPYPKTSVPALDPGYVSPALRIMARIADHARAGMRHPSAAVVHPEGSFTNLQVAKLRADPNLIVEDAGSAGPAGAIDLGATRAQLEAHLKADPLGLVSILRDMGFGRAWGFLGEPAQAQTHVDQFGVGGAPGSAGVSIEARPAEPRPASGAAGYVVTDEGAGLGPSGDQSGVEQESARRGHSPEVAGANPAPAPNTAPPAPPPAEPPADATAASRGKSGKGAAS